LSKRNKVWLGAVAAVLATLVVGALALPKSFALAALCDVTDTLLLASGAAAFIPLAVRARGRMRMFWSLIALGLTFWLGYQVFWTYYEVVLRREVPDLCVGDVVLFLHVVPLMAALALRPHAPRDEYAARLGRLDFALLLVWWFYLYVLIVMPWQYVVADVAAYDRNLNSVYIAENIAFLAGLFACWGGSKGHWRTLYAGLFGASLCYTLGSALANWAIGQNAYYTGGFYDIPIAASMAWLTCIGLSTKAAEPQVDIRQTSTVYGVWIARCSMIAVFSLPLFAAWAMSDNAVSPRIRVFRLALTLAAAFLMGLLVFARQHLLDRELIHLLDQSQESFDSLQRLQAQILQSEKLASIGQLVGGAAHELNNPITAMLGYSDMLLSTQLTAEQQPLAAKIGQYVRRTKSLVASLISFARQTPVPKSPVDLNTLARTAVKLTQPQWKALGIEVRTEFDPALPKVLGDSNQLLQVCLQLMANCLHVLNERGGRVMTVSTETVSTESQSGISVVQIATEAAPVTASADGPAIPVDFEDGLGLSACQGILQEHHGQISKERRENGALLLRMELPVTESAPVKPKDSTVPVMWQSQPYA
jgi:signal transduction histidine kinase